MLEAVLAIVCALSIAGAQTAGPAGVPPDVTPPAASIERIREAVGHSPPLRLPPIPEIPVFRTTVEPPMFPPESALEAALRDLAASPGASGGAGGFDVFPLLKSAWDAAARARRARAERQARVRVEAELAAFCAVHECPDVEDEPPEGLILPPVRAVRPD